MNCSRPDWKPIIALARAPDSSCSDRNSTQRAVSLVAWIRSNGRRVAALLDVPEDRLPGVEQVAALLLEQRGDEPGGVDGVGVLAADDQAEPLAGAETVGEGVDVGGQVVQRDALLGQVDPLGAGGQPAEQREVAAVAAHHLDDEHPARGDRGLPDLVDVGDDAVQRRVAADAQFGARDRSLLIVIGRQTIGMSSAEYCCRCRCNSWAAS